MEWNDTVCCIIVQVELHLGVVLNDVAVSLVLHLEEEVNRTKANSKKTTKKPQWLSLRSPFDDEVRL